MKLCKILITSMLFVTQMYAFGTFHQQYKTGNNFDFDDNRQGSYKLGFVLTNSQLTFQIKINRFSTNENHFDLRVHTQLGTAGTLITAVATSDTSIIQAKYTTQISAFHWLRIKIPSSVSYDYIHIYYISAFIKVGTVTPIITSIFQNYVDILRDRVFRYIYFNQNRTLNVTLTINTGILDQWETQILKIDQADSNNVKTNVNTGFFNNLPNISPAVSPRIYTGQYTKGYYVIRFRPADNRIINAIYQSDPYPCPYPSTHTDIFQNFPGCFHSSQSQVATFPCITLTNGTCSNCYFGYILVNTICIYNPCNIDEYYLNFTCLKANPSCKQFDRFSGVCWTCLNSNYILMNGNCIVNTCPSEQTNRNNTCVSNYCNNFTLISGICLSCINNAFELINGSCIPVKCFAPNLYFSFNVQSCVSLPVYCAQLNFISQKCSACLSPFVLNATTNICELICIRPQVKWFDQCVNLPQNCDQININRHCSKCKPNFELIVGICQPIGVVIINNP